MESTAPVSQGADFPIYTVGYGARTIDDFLAVLAAYRVGFLVDIRSAPYSRYRPEFSRAPLEAALRAHGIRYVYLGDELGGQPADRSCYTGDDKVDYELLQAKPFYQAGLARLREAWARRLPLALMCSEGKPEACHRSKLVGRSLRALGIPVQHIDEDCALRSQDDVMLAVEGGQLSLFADERPLTSRRRYRPKPAGAEPEAAEKDGDDAG